MKKKLPEKLKIAFGKALEQKKQAISENLRKGNKAGCRSSWEIGYADGMEFALSALNYDCSKGGLE